MLDGFDINMLRNVYALVTYITLLIYFTKRQHTLTGSTNEVLEIRGKFVMHANANTNTL